jgi:hypothetical protein
MTGHGTRHRPAFRRWRLLAVLGSIVVGLFLLVTLVALEGRDVVVLETVDSMGRRRETRTWIASEGGYEWVEAATAERPFLHDVAGRASVRIRSGGRVRNCQAAIVPNPDGHERIRRLLPAKYGWSDRWIGWLTAERGPPLDTAPSNALHATLAPTRWGPSLRLQGCGHEWP